MTRRPPLRTLIGSVTVAFTLLCWLAGAVAQGPPAPGVPPTPIEEALAGEAADQGDGEAQPPVDLEALGLKGVEIPAELQAVKPEIQAELLKIWPKQPLPPDGKFSMAFRDAEIADFLQFMADSTGYLFLVPTDLTGKVTITCQVDVPMDLGFRILDAWLSVNSYSMVRDDAAKTVRVEAAKRSKTRGTLVGSGLDPGKIGDGEGYVTHVILLHTISAAAAKDLVSPMVDQEAGIVTASDDLNALVVTDLADNVARVVSVLSFLEKEVDQVEVHEVEVFRLKRADARSVAQMLTELFRQGTPTQQDIQQMMMRGGGPGGPGGGGPMPNMPDLGLVGTKGRVQVVADERTNAVVVLASRDKLDLVRDIVERMDAMADPEVIYKVFTLVNANAVEVVEALNNLWEQPRGTVSSGRSMFASFMSGQLQRSGAAFYGLKENVAVADIRTNKVIVAATADNMPAFERMVIALDRAKPLTDLTRVYRLKNADATTVAEALNGAFQGGRRFRGFLNFLFGGQANSGGPLDALRDVTATAEPVTNQIIVTAPKQSFDVVDQMIGDLDQRVGQVFVRVIIADITLDDEDMFGVEWNWFAPDAAGGVGTTGDVGFGSSWPQAEREGLRWGMVSQNIQAFLSTLDRRGNVQILSTPHVMMLDNSWGSISIGERIPVLTSESESTSGRITQNIEYKPANITLGVRPQINDSGFVSLDIRQYIDAVEQGVGVAGQPTFVRRRAQSQVLVRDAQTIVVGGILQRNDQKTEHKVPILHDIPLLGSLFEHEHNRSTRTELMVFMTPYIVVNEDDAARHTQEELDRMSHPLANVDASARKDTRWDQADSPSPLEAGSARSEPSAARRIRTDAGGGQMGRE